MAAKSTAPAMAVTARTVLDGGGATADQNPPPKWWIPEGLLLPVVTMEVLMTDDQNALASPSSSSFPGELLPGVD